MIHSAIRSWAFIFLIGSSLMACNAHNSSDHQHSVTNDRHTMLLRYLREVQDLETPHEAHFVLINNSLCAARCNTDYLQLVDTLPAEITYILASEATPPIKQWADTNNYTILADKEGNLERYALAFYLPTLIKIRQGEVVSWTAIE